MGIFDADSGQQSLEPGNSWDVAAEHPRCSIGTSGIRQNPLHRSFGPKIRAELPIPRESRDSLQQVEDPRGYDAERNKGLYPNSAVEVTQPRLSPPGPAVPPLPCRAPASRGGQRSAGKGRDGPVWEYSLKLLFIFIFLLTQKQETAAALWAQRTELAPKGCLQNPGFFNPE